jgi:hypothetical protein
MFIQTRLRYDSIKRYSLRVYLCLFGAWFLILPYVMITSVPIIAAMLFIYLDGVGVLEQLRELALLCLQLRVAANVLLADEDVGHGALLGDVLEGVLDRGAVIWSESLSSGSIVAVNIYIMSLPIWSSSRM